MAGLGICRWCQAHLGRWDPGICKVRLGVQAREQGLSVARCGHIQALLIGPEPAQPGQLSTAMAQLPAHPFPKDLPLLLSGGRWECCLSWDLLSGNWCQWVLNPESASTGTCPPYGFVPAWPTLAQGPCLAGSSQGWSFVLSKTCLLKSIVVMPLR